MKFLPYVLKSLWRQRTRTILTAAGAGTALFVFCFVGAVQEGLRQLTENEEANRRLIVFEANRFCPMTSRLQKSYAGALAEMDGVKDVTPIQVFMNNCRASLDVVVFYGMPRDKIRRFRDLRVIAGSWEDFVRRDDGALVGRALARRRSLNVGDTFSIGTVQVKVAGLFEADRPAEENFVYTDLEFLQYTRGKDTVGVVTQFEILLHENADPEEVCRVIDARYRGGPVATDSRRKGVFEARATADLAELIGFARWLGFACVGLVLTLVGTTTVMAVQDRVREHALLQTLGFSGRLLFFLIVAESLLVTLAGGIVGLAAAILLLNWTDLSVGTEGVVIAFAATPSLALVGLATTAVVGIAAGLVPAWQASRADIVTSLRAT